MAFSPADFQISVRISRFARKDELCKDTSENFVGPRKNNRTALGGTKNKLLGALKFCEEQKSHGSRRQSDEEPENARIPPEDSASK